MGRLAGFGHRDVVTRLKRHGFQLHRTGKGSHEIWVHVVSGRRTVVPNHTGDIPEGTMKGILKLAGIAVDDFLP